MFIMTAEVVDVKYFYKQNISLRVFTIYVVCENSMYLLIKSCFAFALKQIGRVMLDNIHIRSGSLVNITSLLIIYVMEIIESFGDIIAKMYPALASFDRRHGIFVGEDSASVRSRLQHVTAVLAGRSGVGPVGITVVRSA